MMWLYVTVNYEVFTSRYFQLSAGDIVCSGGHMCCSLCGRVLRVKRSGNDEGRFTGSFRRMSQN